jgi:hypothetical protein
LRLFPTEGRAVAETASWSKAAGVPLTPGKMADAFGLIA